jgi:hypothetical protein
MIVLFDRFNLPEDIYKIVFPTERQQIVGKLLIARMQRNGGMIGKTEMSLFATKLHDGELIDDREEVQQGPLRKTPPKLSYNKRQFYDRILTPMKSMGMIEYDLYQKIYKVSDKFNKSMIKIGLLWLRELRKGAEPVRG